MHLACMIKDTSQLTQPSGGQTGGSLCYLGCGFPELAGERQGDNLGGTGRRFERGARFGVTAAHIT